MLPFDEIEQLTAPAQKEAFKAQNNITTKIAEMLALYLFLASTGDFVSAAAVELEFQRYYDKQITDFVNTAPNIAADTVMDYSRQNYDAIATPIMPTFAQNAHVYATATQNAAQAQELIRNITPGTTGITERLPTGRTQFTPTTNFFRNELNNGIKQVVSGNKTYTEVIRDIVKKMSNSGIRTMTTQPTEHLPNGRTERIDVIVRRAIMTGIKDTITDNAYEMARQMGTTFFEISYHEGYRPSHWWGGRRISTVTTDTIDIQTGKPFMTEDELRERENSHWTDYNCRHYIYPISPEEPPIYTAAELRQKERDEAKQTECKGKGFNPYEAGQRMRELEREMRALRLEGKLLKETGLQDEYKEVRLKYRAASAEYSDFSRVMGLKEQRERIYYDMLSRVF